MEELKDVKPKDMKSLEEVLATTETSHVIEKHLVQFSCDTKADLNTVSVDI